jgi:hypothetical protein
LSQWNGGIEVIEQESIGIHSFTRRLLACDSDDEDAGVDDGWNSKSRGDDDDDDDDGDDDGDDDDIDHSQRKNAQKKFAALKEQLLHASGDGASAPRPPKQGFASSTEDLSGGLLDSSVRFWTDFQQVMLPVLAHDFFPADS